MAAAAGSPALPRLFEPLRVGPMTVANRIVMAPMERNYAEPDGAVSQRTIAHYRARAHGGVGWIDVESTFVDPGGRGRTHQLGLHDDRLVEGFQALVQAAHEEGAKIGIELHHAGRNTCSAISAREPVAPSPVACPEAGGELPRQLTPTEIDEILERYAAAARRAAAAGFDAVELHSAHGYLPLAFLSPLTNLRSDEYGGSLENRMRFALRALAALREGAGDELAVGCRFSAQEHLPGGLQLQDTLLYAQALEAAGADYLSVSAGVYASFTRIIPPMDFEEGWLLPAAASVKAAVGVPVIGASRIVDPRLAERAIAAGEVDLVALGRALLTDPQLPSKARRGRLCEIVSCIGCNQGCESRISAQRDVTCLVNPEVGRELSFALRPAAQAKRVVVVGGGPAGMEAARVCAQRGHDVVLYERDARLGGAIALAAKLPRRDGWKTFLVQAERRLRDSGVEVVLGCEVDEARLRESRAEVVLLATGARFVLPEQPDATVPLLAPAQLLADGTAGSATAVLAPGAHVLIVGGGAVGLGLASWLQARGAHATVLCEEAQIADPAGQGGLVQRLCRLGGVSLRAERQLVRLDRATAEIARSGAIGPLFGETIEGLDAVVWAAERRPRNELAALLARHADGCELHELGDCKTPRSALEAVYECAATGRSI